MSASGLPRDTNSYSDDGRRGKESLLVVQHLAHELRQPLSAIETIGYYLKMIADGGDPKALEQIEKLQHLVDRANWILDDAIHYLQACPPRPALFDVNEMISQLCAELSLEGEHYVHLQLGENLPLTMLDPAQGEHMLKNVLALAQRVSGAPFEVRIGTAASAEQIEVQFEFSATCAPPGDLGELLSPFAADAPDGRGLALASARRIAEAHGGQARVERRGESLGVTITLPAAQSTFHAADVQ
ncbi:MAG: hypothetical protein SFV54_06975 [Bryobacteraceae bacterium]|nr:hypothetical protein [Bryobacteraceae bacterium]